jgi:hypothetical protein
MLEHGATTCWEIYASSNFNQGGMLTRSHCHAWSAAPGYFLGAYILGVRSVSVGWKDVVIKPQPCDLMWAKGTVPLPRGGNITVSWKISRDLNSIQIRAESPKEVSVSFRLPEGLEGIIEHIQI